MHDHCYRKMYQLIRDDGRNREPRDDDVDASAEY